MTELTPENRKSRTGCGVMSLLPGAAALVGAVYLLSRWDELGGAGRTGGIVLAVLGALLVLPVLLVLGLRLFMMLMLRRAAGQLGKMGEAMIAETRAMYGEIHEFRGATEDDFATLDRNYYEATTRQLSESGFRHLGDVVDATIEAAGGPSPVIRILASPDGTTTVALYHFNPPQAPAGFEGETIRICDVTTEFSDETFLVTSNTSGLDMMTPPPQLRKRQHRLHTPVAELIREHDAERQKLLAARPGVTARAMSTLDDVLESERRQQAVKNAHRKEIGYLDPDEVRRIARSVDADEGLADLSAQAADDARRKQREA